MSSSQFQGRASRAGSPIAIAPTPIVNRATSGARVQASRFGTASRPSASSAAAPATAATTTRTPRQAGGLMIMPIHATATYAASAVNASMRTGASSSPADGRTPFHAVGSGTRAPTALMRRAPPPQGGFRQRPAVQCSPQR